MFLLFEYIFVSGVFIYFAACIELAAMAGCCCTRVKAGAV